MSQQRFQEALEHLVGSDISQEIVYSGVRNHIITLTVYSEAMEKIIKKTKVLLVCM